jgi:hypothetical protein
LFGDIVSSLADLWVVAAFSLFVLLAAVGLVVWHVRTWHAVQRQRPEAEEFDYRRRQFRRRVQTSAMLGLLGVGIFAGRLLMVFFRSPVLLLIYWGGVLLLLGWVALLAAADMLATKVYFSRIRQRCLIEQAKLQAQLNRLRAVRGNGKAKGRHNGGPS